MSPAVAPAVAVAAAPPPAKPARKPAKGKPAGAKPAQQPALTRREAEALAALAADPAASSVVLGRRLGVSAGTARKYLEAVRAKLGVGKEVAGAALVALARERRLLAADVGAGAEERLVGSRPRPAEEG